MLFLSVQLSSATRDAVNARMLETVNTTEARQFLPLLYQVISRLSLSKKYVALPTPMHVH